jgi:hypothetical protein
MDDGGSDIFASLLHNLNDNAEFKEKPIFYGLLNSNDD